MPTQTIPPIPLSRRHMGNMATWHSRIPSIHHHSQQPPPLHQLDTPTPQFSSTLPGHHHLQRTQPHQDWETRYQNVLLEHGHARTPACHQLPSSAHRERNTKITIPEVPPDMHPTQRPQNCYRPQSTHQKQRIYPLGGQKNKTLHQETPTPGTQQRNSPDPTHHYNLQLTQPPSDYYYPAKTPAQTTTPSPNTHPGLQTEPKSQGLPGQQPPHIINKRDESQPPGTPRPHTTTTAEPLLRLSVQRRNDWTDTAPAHYTPHIPYNR